MHKKILFVVTYYNTQTNTEQTWSYHCNNWFECLDEVRHACQDHEYAYIMNSRTFEEIYFDPKDYR